MQVLEVRRVQTSADLLHPGEYVFIPKREPKITYERVPMGPPIGLWEKLTSALFKKKYRVVKAFESLWPLQDTVILNCPECNSPIATTKNHKIVSVEPLTLDIPLTCPYCKTKSFDIKEGKITPIVYHAT